MTSAVNAAGNVWQRYKARLAEVEKQIAEDAAANPHAHPDPSLTEERWKLHSKLRTAEKLAQIFSEEQI